MGQKNLLGEALNHLAAVGYLVLGVVQKHLVMFEGCCQVKEGSFVEASKFAVGVNTEFAVGVSTEFAVEVSTEFAVGVSTEFAVGMGMELALN
jgi:hypothetical protein